MGLWALAMCVAVKSGHCCYYFFGLDRLCGSTGTVFGPGFGASGFFLGVGDGVDLLCGFTGTVFFVIVLKFKG